MFQKNLNCVPNNSRVLVRNAHADSRDTPFFVTLTRDDEGRKFAVDDQGRRYKYAMNWKFEPKSPDVPSLCVLWSGPFPKLGEAAIIDFYQNLLPSLRTMGNMSATPLMVHLTEVGETHASGYIVQSGGMPPILRHMHLDASELVKREHTVWSAEPITIARETLPRDAAIGDLIISKSFSCVGEKIGDDVLVKTMLASARAIVRNCTQEDVLCYMPPTDHPNTPGADFSEVAFDYWSPTASFELATLEDHKWLVASALSEFDPNFAIILLVTNEDGQQNIFNCGQYGRELFGLDNLLEELVEADIKEGAWAFVKPRIVSGYPNRPTILDGIITLISTEISCR